MGKAVRNQPRLQKQVLWPGASTRSTEAAHREAIKFLFFYLSHPRSLLSPPRASISANQILPAEAAFLAHSFAMKLCFPLLSLREKAAD